MSSTNLPPRMQNNKTSEHLQRDVPSVEYSEQKTSAGQMKVILIDRTRRHRSFSYVKKHGSIMTARNELALDFLSKFSAELDLRVVGRSISKKGKD